jgi:hypothetical protein
MSLFPNAGKFFKKALGVLLPIAGGKFRGRPSAEL